MKHYFKYLLLTVLCFTAIPNIVSASTYVGIVSGTSVLVRKGPGTNYGSYSGSVNSGNTLTVNDPTLKADESTNQDNLCPNGWYSVTYKDQIGYICSNYLTVNEVVESKEEDATPSTECETEMKNAGFPSSYWSGLCALRKKYPSWQFIAVSKDSEGNSVDFNTSVVAEMGCKRNTISTSAADSYKRSDGVCTGALDSGYTYASEEAVRHYMDPRNFLDEKNIFMFEDQNVNPSIDAGTYSSSMKSMFNTMLKKIEYFPELVINASSQSGLSQTAIGSRIRQELGDGVGSGGNLYCVIAGNYTSKYGWYYSKANGWKQNDPTGRVSLDVYYNFYNIGSNDGSNVTQTALSKAVNLNWGGTGDQKTDRQIAMTEGAKWIYSHYTGAGQNTIYFNKFNIFPNVASSRYLNQYMTNIQAITSEAAILYKAYSNNLSLPFKFYIPVFSDINYVAIDSGSSVVDTSKPAVSTAVTNSGFAYNNGYVSKINPGTSVNDIKSALESQGVSVNITDANGNAAGNIIGTGYKVQISGATQETLIAVVYGDVSGDGEINALDLLKVQKVILGTASLNGSYLTAADPSKDGQINALDLLKIQKHILKSASIEQ